jgi:hypothetical protein
MEMKYSEKGVIKMPELPDGLELNSMIHAIAWEMVRQSLLVHKSSDFQSTSAEKRLDNIIQLYERAYQAIVKLAQANIGP